MNFLELYNGKKKMNFTYFREETLKKNEMNCSESKQIYLNFQNLAKGTTPRFVGLIL